MIMYILLFKVQYVIFHPFFFLQHSFSEASLSFILLRSSFIGLD